MPSRGALSRWSRPPRRARRGRCRRLRRAGFRRWRHRGVTADDARLRVRNLDDSAEGPVEFWADTLCNDCLQRGYELIERGALVDADGESGRWLRFHANVSGEKVGLLVAVWVRPRLLGKPYLQVAEFAARDLVFTARLPAVQAALAKLRR